jgi:hypothetical protein
MRGASSARGTATIRPVSGEGAERYVGEGVYVDGVGEAAPGLDLLRDFLRVVRGKHASDASVFKGVRQGIQELRYGVRQANGC